MRNTTPNIHDEVPKSQQAADNIKADTPSKPLLKPGVPGASMLRSTSSSSSVGGRSFTPIKERVLEWEKQTVVIKDLTQYLQPLPAAKARGGFGIVTKAKLVDSYNNFLSTVAVKSLHTRSQDRPIPLTKVRFRFTVSYLQIMTELQM